MSFSVIIVKLDSESEFWISAATHFKSIYKTYPDDEKSTSFFFGL